VTIWRLFHAVFSGQLFREATDLIRIRARGPDLIVFYCSSWVDEIYIRSSIDACVARNLNVVIIISDKKYISDQAASNARYFLLSPRFLKFTKASILVSASTGIDSKYIPDTCSEVIHMPHSLVSMNMIYGLSAFDSFTRFFVCGDYQSNEIRELDILQNRKPRPSCVVGYGKSDVILDSLDNDLVEKGLVLIAPSWGSDGFIETIGKATISALLDANIRVCLRPHPRYMRHSRDLIDDITESFSKNENFYFENPLFLSKAMDRADVVISDYCGAAFEYIFTKIRPVIFVDIPLKKNNPLFDLCKNVPVEISWRDKLGIVVFPFPEDILSATLNFLGGKEKSQFSIDAYFKTIAWDGKCCVRVAEKLEVLIAKEEI
jgi:hypothetical protein